MSKWGYGVAVLAAGLLVDMTATVVAALPVRDPFQPLLSLPCGDVGALTDWRLQGVIGHGEQWYGWVVTPSGEWRRLHSGQSVVASGGRVMSLDARALWIQLPPSATGCTARRVRFSLGDAPLVAE